jgi:hypothetical protein
MRTQTQRRRTTVAIVLLALAAASVLWVAFTMDSKGNTGIALDGSGSGSVKSGSSGSDSVGTDSAESGLTGSGSTGSDSTGSSSSTSGSSDSRADHGTAQSRIGAGSTGSGTTGSHSTGSTNNRPTNSGSPNASSGPSGSGHGSGAHAGDHGTGNGNNGGAGHTDPPPVDTTGLSVRVGSVGALFPGAHTTAPVTVTDKTNGDVALTEIRASSSGVTGCGTSYLYLGHRTLRPSLTIPGRGQVTTRVRFGLRASAPNSCKGKTIPFSVIVRAVSR